MDILYNMKIDVVKVAKLANLPLTSAEEKKFGKQLSSILDYMEVLNKVDTSNVEPTSQVTGLKNVMREDETEPCAKIKEGFFVTKGIFNE